VRSAAVSVEARRPVVQIGDQVQHQIYGRGTIDGERHFGYEHQVRFDSGTRIWVQTRSLIPVSDTDPEQTPTLHQEEERAVIEQAAPPIRPHRSKTLYRNATATKNAEIRSVIEAFRLGGVPGSTTALFHCGRREELARVQSWLSGDVGSLRIEGEYGIGKSHLLEIAMDCALSDGWCVAKIEVDPNEFTFHKPKNIYLGLIHSFTFLHDRYQKTYREFIRLILASENRAGIEELMTHPYLGELFRLWNKDDEPEWLLNWMEGDEENRSDLPKFYDSQVSANIYCNIISGLGWAAKNILGYKGLLILFDEAESLDRNWYSHYQFEKAENMLRGLIMIADNEERCRLEEITRSPAGGSRSAGLFGEETGLCYCGQKNHQFPYLWNTRSEIKIIFSFVPGMIDSMPYHSPLYDRFSHIPSISLDSLKEDDFIELYQKILCIYADAYSDKPRADVYHLLPKKKTRMFVKATVEAFDLMRLHPEMDIGSLLQDT
jgi:hypothetical protein